MTGGAVLVRKRTTCKVVENIILSALIFTFRHDCKTETGKMIFSSSCWTCPFGQLTYVLLSFLPTIRWLLCLEISKFCTTAGHTILEIRGRFLIGFSTLINENFPISPLAPELNLPEIVYTQFYCKHCDRSSRLCFGTVNVSHKYRGRYRSTYLLNTCR